METTNNEKMGKDIVMGYASRELSMNGCLALVSAILFKAHDDYVEALNTIMNIKKISSDGGKNKRKLSNAYREKNSCEEFYRSQLFQIYTLGYGFDGDDVISRIQKEVNFIDK